MEQFGKFNSFSYICIELTNMKEKILKLRAEGKTYNEIKTILNCSKSIICYYCGVNQKEKNQSRQKERRKDHLKRKTDAFKHSSRKFTLNRATLKFQKNNKKIYNKTIIPTFGYRDVLEKFGEYTTCYLSGEKINLLKDNNYSLDHIDPASKGGDNSLDNLGILHSVVNQMKFNLTNEEFIEWCKKILIHNGYTITSP